MLVGRGERRHCRRARAAATPVASWANSLRAPGRAIYLRPMHEMNGNWYPWAGGVNGNSPALYVQAWRRLVTISRQHGARNVRFVWEPYTVDSPMSSPVPMTACANLARSRSGSPRSAGARRRRQGGLDCRRSTSRVRAGCAGRSRATTRAPWRASRRGA